MNVHTGDKVESTLSTLLKADKVDRVALAPYTPATKSTATSCRIHVVADLLQKPATKLNVYGMQQSTLLPICSRFRQQSTFNKVDRDEFNSVSGFRSVVTSIA